LPLVSIVMPTRNGFSLLRRCVESIFAKTQYANYSCAPSKSELKPPKALTCAVL
jgi:hypothetical protein